MTASIKIANFSDINILESSEVAGDIQAGATSITLLNNQNIGTNSTILIGQPGAETGELVAVSSASGATILLTLPTKLAHYRNEPVFSLFGTKLRIYRANNTNNLPPADATYTNIAEVDIDPDQLETTYTDPSGSSAYWYKYTYYNDVQDLETPLTDSLASRSGGGYVSLYDIRKEAGFEGAAYISEGDIDQKRKTAQSQIDGALSGQFQTPFNTPVNDTIREITLQLAAGMLQLTQFGRYATQDTNNGQLRIDWAEKQIEKIKAGQLKLVGVDGIATPEQPVTSGGVSGGGASGYPTSRSAPGYMFEREYIEEGQRHW